MPKGRVERLIPRRYQTVGNMIAEGVKVRAHCSKCDLTLVVDLELLKSHNGETFSLIGKRGKCRRLNCDGSVISPFLKGCVRRTYAAIFSFMAGVMPPMPMFGRSLL
jgi:hypothetical protein